MDGPDRLGPSLARRHAERAAESAAEMGIAGKAVVKRDIARVAAGLVRSVIAR